MKNAGRVWIKRRVASEQDLLTAPVLCCALWPNFVRVTEFTIRHDSTRSSLLGEVILGGPGSGKSLLGSSLQRLGTSTLS